MRAGVRPDGRLTAVCMVWLREVETDNIAASVNVWSHKAGFAIRCGVSMLVLSQFYQR